MTHRDSGGACDAQAGAGGPLPAAGVAARVRSVRRQRGACQLQKKQATAAGSGSAAAAAAAAWNLAAGRAAHLCNSVSGMPLPPSRTHQTILLRPHQQTRAKAIRKFVDKMIGLAKDGSLHARRQALGFIYDPELVKSLFEQVRVTSFAVFSGLVHGWLAGWASSTTLSWSSP